MDQQQQQTYHGQQQQQLSQPQQHIRRASDTYDIMNRLRTSFIGRGDSLNEKWHTSLVLPDYGSIETPPPSNYHLSVSSQSSNDDEEVASIRRNTISDNDEEKKALLVVQSNNDENDDNHQPTKSKSGIIDEQNVERRKSRHHHRQQRQQSKNQYFKVIKRAAYQIPSIVLIGMFHLMVGIPFGVSYFPIGWRQNYNPVASLNATDIDPTLAMDVVNGPFPLKGKEALGIRMFLFATIVGQVSFTLTSGFKNPIGLQMIENVPFCHELSRIAIHYQGYGIEALSTIFVMFGLASIIVGVVFYTLGIFQLGRVVYYFPKHVLVGCIGGIGIFLAKTGMEVTMNESFSVASIAHHWNLLIVAFLFEFVLRILERCTRDECGKAKYPLLSPIYFCSITPIFYTILLLLGTSVQTAKDAGYFFPAIDVTSETTSDGTIITPTFFDTIFNKDIFDIWRVIDLSTVSIPAIIDAIPTIIALILFSLIHVPINIPAFALSSDCADEIDMNQELVSHGYANIISGLVGGLQNYMAYTQSVVYHKSGGTGVVSGIAVAVLTSILFIIGPTIASYIPRSMAGCLLLHVGADLFLEGVYDSYGQFDYLEYAGIWLIVIVMTLWGMEASMIAGFVAAISTYAVQNTAYVNPIRGSMKATTLRSSHFQRSPQALDILSDPTTGRSRILVIQLQGHLFFGNVANFMDAINDIVSHSHTNPDELLENGMNEKVNGISSTSTRSTLATTTSLTTITSTSFLPLIIIIDFGLVLGIDSSAAQAILKIRNVMRKNYNIDLCIFVTGNVNGFPTFYNLTNELSNCSSNNNNTTTSNDEQHPSRQTNLMTGLLNPPQVPTPNKYTGSHVFVSLDEALTFAENALIARHDPAAAIETTTLLTTISEGLSNELTNEQDLALLYLTRLAPKDTDPAIIQELFLRFTRETFEYNDYIWKQGSTSDCAKILIKGQLVAMLEDEAGTQELISQGNLLGELGLVEGIPRMSTVRVVGTTLHDDGRNVAVLYTLHRNAYEQLIQSQPACARIIDLICVRYLAARVQHVSNRIFETRCLPV